jgi:hypothetical protein
VFVFLYGLLNWAEYSALTAFSIVNIESNYPFSIFINEYTSPPIAGIPPNTGFRAILFFNYPLIIFALATTLNLYFIYKLQKSKETKQNPT